MGRVLRCCLARRCGVLYVNAPSLVSQTIADYGSRPAGLRERDLELLLD